jgi:hypothetical protein
MEGSSLRLAAELLVPLVGQVIQEVSGNTKIEKERFLNKKIQSIFLKIFTYYRRWLLILFKITFKGVIICDLK